METVNVSVDNRGLEIQGFGNGFGNTDQQRFGNTGVWKWVWKYRPTVLWKYRGLEIQTNRGLEIQGLEIQTNRGVWKYRGLEMGLEIQTNRGLEIQGFGNGFGNTDQQGFGNTGVWKYRPTGVWKYRGWKYRPTGVWKYRDLEMGLEIQTNRGLEIQGFGNGFGNTD